MEQVVKIDNTMYKHIQVTSGVPQGCHLDYLLLNKIINDILNYILLLAISKILLKFKMILINWC